MFTGLIFIMRLFHFLSRLFCLCERSYGLGDELSLAVDAGVGALAGDLLLLLGDATRGRGRPTCVEGTWDGGEGGARM